MSRFRVIRVYDVGVEGDILIEGATFQGNLQTVLNEQVGEEEYVISVNEARTNSGTAFYTVVIEDLSFRFPLQEQEDSEIEAEEAETETD